MIACQPIRYNLSEMSTRTLDQRRQGIHRAIRLQQLQMRFEQERKLLREVQPAAARDIMGDSLLGLQRAFEQGDQQAIILHLTQLRSIAKQYQIAEFLLGQMRLSPEMEVVREGRIGMECTTIDLFMLFLKADNEVIREHASALMQDSLFQMRGIMSRKIHNKSCEEQIRRVVDQFHPQLLFDQNIRVALHSLSAMQELLLTPICHHTLPYLLGIYPQFLQVIVNLFQQVHFANVSEYSQKVVDLCLIILFVTSSLMQFSLLPEMQEMKESVRQAIVRKIFLGEFQQELFSRIRVLSQCKVALQQQQLDYLLQNTLIRQLNNKNTQYLKMLATVLQMGQLFFPTDAIHLLINRLFKPIQDTSEEELEYRRWLVNVVYKNASILKEMLREDIDHVIQGWQDPIFSERIAFLVKLAFRGNEALFYLLLEICCCLYEAVPSLTPILNRTFSFLRDYKEWRNLLESRPLAVY